MRNVYKVLAIQYDPVGYIIPFITRAKVLLQQLWIKRREWDDPIPPGELQQAWSEWENVLLDLDYIQYPRWYDFNIPCPVKQRQLHIFCDASERTYDSVASFTIKDEKGGTQLSFFVARTRVVPKKQLTIPP